MATIFVTAFLSADRTSPQVRIPLETSLVTGAVKEEGELLRVYFAKSPPWLICDPGWHVLHALMNSACEPTPLTILDEGVVG